MTCSEQQAMSMCDSLALMAVCLCQHSLLVATNMSRGVRCPCPQHSHPLGGGLPALTAMSYLTSPAPPLSPPHTHPHQYLAECRASLLAGLKRHFRFKAAEGLLSKASLRALEYACDCGLSRPGQPLTLWKEVSSRAGQGRVALG